MCYLFLLHSQPSMDRQVVLGSLSLNDVEPTEQVIQVQEAILHENYRETREAVYNDIGEPSLSLILYKQRISYQQENFDFIYPFEL